MAAKQSDIVRLLHVDPPIEEKMRRWVDVARAMPRHVSHTVAGKAVTQSGLREVGQSIKTTAVDGFPELAGFPGPKRLNALARAMQPYDLILTYGANSLDAVMAHTAFSQAYAMPPLVHHEGDRDPEPPKEGRARLLYRRVAFGRCSGIVVPNEAWEAQALVAWQQPLGRVKRIGHGFDVRRFAAKPKPDAMPGLIKKKDERWAGLVWDGQDDSALSVSVEAMTKLHDGWQLVVLADAEVRDTLLALADRNGIYHRVHLVQPGDTLDRALGLLDVFLAIDTSLVREAMAAGLPVVTSSVGLSEDIEPGSANLVYDDGDQLRNILDRFDRDPAPFAKAGEANRRQALAQFDEQALIGKLHRLYASAMKREKL